jgi:DNA-binding transcriptional MerR regulator
VTSYTIGEVLNQLKGDFEDITISKIRFLEAEGLISPDRTESGYRKFTPTDVERLRYVLRAQRERYLPLKVIKEELARRDAGLPGESPSGGAAGTSADGPAGSADAAAQPADAANHGWARGDAGRFVDGALTDVQLSMPELAAASGLSEVELDALRDHGLLGEGPAYDGDDLQVAKLAAALLASGLEVRHLRMYLQFAAREAALVEALVVPLLRQRNPASRRAAIDHAEHVAMVGGELHRALLVKQLRHVLRS